MKPGLIERFKRRIRGFGWCEYDPAALRCGYFYFRQVYDPAAIVKKLNLPGHEYGQAVREEIYDHDEYRFTEYVLKIPEPVVVEPLHGMIVASGNRLARSLLAVHCDVYVPPPHQLQYVLSLRNSSRIQEAISLRHHYGEENYGHFYSDVLSKLLVLKQCPELEHLPLLVSRRQFEKEYFQGAMARAGLRDRRWIIQDGASVRIERLWCAKGLSYTREWLEGIWNMLQVPSPDLNSSRRVFLTRFGNPRRPLQNQNEIRDLMARMGFEVMDPGKIPFNEQIALFSGIRYLVAEHGSACANVLFRRDGPLSFIELFPPEYISTAFFMISHLQGQNYELFRGEAEAGREEAYHIDPVKLEKRIKEMLRG